jgi:hypothetical protein
MRKLTNTLRPSPKGFQSPKFSDSDFREVCWLGLGLERPKSSDKKVTDFGYLRLSEHLDSENILAHFSYILLI